MDCVRLHLGCGKRELKGFIHLDIADYPHIDYKHDTRTLPMFADDSVDLIYASHILEYYDRIEVKSVLSEWKRVLKVDGILRIAVPDFAALVQVYRKYDKLDLILGPLFGYWPVPGSNSVIYHKTVYDYSSLKDLLEICGFGNIKKWEWREFFSGELEGYDDYSQAYIPHMRKEDGLLISLNVEASKTCPTR